MFLRNSFVLFFIYYYKGGRRPQQRGGMEGVKEVTLFVIPIPPFSTSSCCKERSLSNQTPKASNLPAAAGGAGVLTTDADAPPVTETAVGADLLEALDVVAELGVEVLGEDLGVLAGLPVLLSVEEPEGDLELAGVLDDGNELLDLVGGELAGALVDVDLGLLADEVGEAAAEALDLGQGEDDVSLTLNVGVEDTQNVLELLGLHQRPGWDRDGEFAERVN